MKKLTEKWHVVVGYVVYVLVCEYAREEVIEYLSFLGSCCCLGTVIFLERWDLVLVFVLDFTYAQNFFGSLLMSFAISFSKSILNLLVSDLSAFLALR